MITIHHLGVSQSERIVWLMEELGLPYRLKWYDRKPNKAAPDEYLALHPTAMAPVIEDGDQVLTESAVIVEYVCHRYAGGRMTVGPAQPNYYDYLYWMHFNNSAMGLRFTKSVLQAGATGPVADTMGEVVRRREEQFYNQSHIKGSVSIPQATVRDRLAEIPNTGNVVVYCDCPHDEESAGVAYSLRSTGRSNVKVLEGPHALALWSGAGYPVEP